MPEVFFTVIIFPGIAGLLFGGIGAAVRKYFGTLGLLIFGAATALIGLKMMGGTEGFPVGIGWIAASVLGCATLEALARSGRGTTTRVVLAAMVFATVTAAGMLVALPKALMVG